MGKLGANQKNLSVSIDQKWWNDIQALADLYDNMSVARYGRLIIRKWWIGGRLDLMKDPDLMKATKVEEAARKAEIKKRGRRRKPKIKTT